MKTQINQQQWGRHSASYWITLILALGIIFIGIRFIVRPYVGAIGYGVPFTNDHDAIYGMTKGIRDIFLGVVLLPLLAMHMRKATAWVFIAAIIVPVGDFLIILITNGVGDTQHLLIHGITALVMIINSILLFNTNKESLKN